TGNVRSLTDGTTTANQFAPIASPDGTRFVFSEISSNLDIATMNVDTAAVSPLIATSRNELMPAWTADGSSLVYVTDRDGELGIWLREGDKGDRPLVTFGDFPTGTTVAFMVPSVSPDGTRVMYSRVEGGVQGLSGAHLWMSSVTGGAPMRLRDGL